MSGWCSDTYLCSPAAPSAPFRIFDAFREEYLCTLKKFLFLSICRLFHLVFPQDMHGKNVGRIFWMLFWGTHTVETVLKRLWMRHCLIQLNISNMIQIVTYFFPFIFLSKIIFVATNDFIGLMFNFSSNESGNSSLNWRWMKM